MLSSAVRNELRVSRLVIYFEAFEGFAWTQWLDPSCTCCELLKLLLQGDGGIVGTKHFGRQSVHQLLEVLV